MQWISRDFNNKVYKKEWNLGWGQVVDGDSVGIYCGAELDLIEQYLIFYNMLV